MCVILKIATRLVNGFKRSGFFMNPTKMGKSCRSAISNHVISDSSSLTQSIAH